MTVTVKAPPRRIVHAIYREGDKRVACGKETSIYNMRWVARHEWPTVTCLTCLSVMRVDRRDARYQL